MTINTSIDTNNHLVTHTIEGELTLQEVKAAAINLYGNPDFQSDMGILVDLRNGTAQHLSNDELQEFLMMTRAMEEKRGSGRSAFLAAKDVDYGIGRICQALLDDTSRRLRVFRDLQEAIDWLAEGRD